MQDTLRSARSAESAVHRGVRGIGIVLGAVIALSLINPMTATALERPETVAQELTEPTPVGPSILAGQIVQSGALASGPRSHSNDVRAMAEYAGYIWLTSHTNLGTYSYVEGSSITVTCYAEDLDDWGEYQAFAYIYDTVTNTTVASQWAQDYVYLYDSYSAVFSLAGLVPSTGRYQVGVALWDDNVDYQVIEDSEYFNLNVTAQTPSPPPSPVVKPKVALTKGNAPRTMYEDRARKVTGYLKPRHASGSRKVEIKLYKYSKTKHAYVYKTHVHATLSNYSTYSKWVRYIKFPTKGTWRIRAYMPADAEHAASYSSYDYITVK